MERAELQWIGIQSLELTARSHRTVRFLDILDNISWKSILLQALERGATIGKCLSSFKTDSLSSFGYLPTWHQHPTSCISQMCEAQSNERETLPILRMAMATKGSAWDSLRNSNPSCWAHWPRWGGSSHLLRPGDSAYVAPTVELLGPNGVKPSWFKGFKWRFLGIQVESFQIQRDIQGGDDEGFEGFFFVLCWYFFFVWWSVSCFCWMIGMWIGCERAKW